MIENKQCSLARLPFNDATLFGGTDLFYLMRIADYYDRFYLIVKIFTFLSLNKINIHKNTSELILVLGIKLGKFNKIFKI